MWITAKEKLGSPTYRSKSKHGALRRKRPEFSAMLDLEKALRESSVNASGGVLERGSEQFVIRSTGLFASLADVGATRVATRDGQISTPHRGPAPAAVLLRVREHLAFAE